MASTPALRIAAWLVMGCLFGPAAWADEVDDAEQQLQAAPKQVLTLAEQRAQALPLNDPARARWLAIGSEAAYALALPDAAIRYAEEGLAQPALEVAMRQRLAIAQAQALDLSGRSKESIDLLMTVIATLEKGAFDKQLLVDAVTSRASAYYSTNNFRASLADLLRAYPLAPMDGSRTIRADVAQALGNVYAAMEDYPHAEQFYLESIDYSVAHETWVRASISEYSLAAVYRRKSDFAKAAEYFERARANSIKADDVQGVAYAEYGLAQVALKLEDYAKAERMFIHSLPVFVEAGDLLPQANIAHGLAKIDFSRKQYAQTLQRIAKALKLVDKVADFNLRYELLSLQSEAEFELGEYRNAYISLKQAAENKQAALTARNEESLSEMRVRFDTERQAQQNVLLQQQNQLNAAKLAEQKQTARLYVVSVFALLVILGFLVYLGWRARQVRARLAAQALTDELTGVANRRQVMRVLAAEFERARRYRTPLVVAVFDLDHFKQINDRFGHAAGDQVLVAFATAMADSLRKTDLFGRVGGEEFLAILPQTPPAEALAVAERMRVATLGLVCPALKGEVTPSVSIGLSQLRPEDPQYDDMLKRADEAVYAAKDGGRNRVVTA